MQGIKRTSFEYQETKEVLNPKYIRVIREAGGLGDIVRVVAVCQGLKKKYPSAQIHLYGPITEGSLIFPRASYAIDLYIPCRYGSRERDILPDERIHKHLKRGISYDLTYDGWCPPYLHEPATKGLVNIDRTELWCRSANVDFCRPYFTPTQGDLFFAEETKKQFKGKKIIGIQAGATCRSREYPYKYWSWLIEKFHTLGIQVILFDVCRRGFKELPVSKFFASINQPWSLTVGRILATDLMITPDSGFYHLSGMLKKKCLGIFGCTNGEVISRVWQKEIKTGYFIQLKLKEVNYNDLPHKCKPRCYMRYERGWDARYYREQGNYCHLMTQLKPKRVLKRALELIKD